MSLIPQTQARLTTSITLYALPGNVAVNTATSASALAAIQGQGVKIGAVESFTETQTRRSAPRYEIDADEAGNMVERIPELVDRTIRLSRVVLYQSGDILQAFGFTDAYDIIQQNVSFSMTKVERYPDNLNLPTVTTIYTGLWFHEIPKTFTMTGDLKVLQDVEIGVTSILKA